MADGAVATVGKDCHGVEGLMEGVEKGEGGTIGYSWGLSDVYCCAEA